MPTNNSTEGKEFQPYPLALAALPPPNPKTIGRLRTVTDVTPPSIYMDFGTYWSAIAGGAGLASFNLKSFGAKGDNSTNDTTAIQNAVNTVAAASVGGIFGAKLVVPPGVYRHNTITMPTNTNLVIEGLGYGSPSSGSVFKYLDTTGRQFDLGSVTHNLSMRGLYLLGSGGTTETNDSVYVASADMAHIEYCSFNNFGGSAVRTIAGSNMKLMEVEAQNCLLASVPSSYSGLSARRGVLEFNSTETVLNNCNINGVAGTLDANSGRIGNGFMIPIYFKTGAGVTRCLNTVAAFGQYGWVFESSQYHQVNGCRAEYNQGHGFVLECQQSSFMNCRTQDNSHDTDNTYDGFYVTGWSNALTNNLIQSVVFTNKHRYGIHVNVGAGVEAYRNTGLSNNLRTDSTGRALYHFDVLNNTPFSVNGLNFRQVLTGTGSQAFDGMSGDFMKLTVDANTATTITLPTTNLIPYHGYTMEVVNSSGFAPTIVLDTMFNKMTGYAAPANGKYRYLTFMYDGSNIIGTSTGDI